MRRDSVAVAVVAAHRCCHPANNHEPRLPLFLNTLALLSPLRRPCWLRILVGCVASLANTIEGRLKVWDQRASNQLNRISADLYAGGRVRAHCQITLEDFPVGVAGKRDQTNRQALRHFVVSEMTRTVFEQ